MHRLSWYRERFPDQPRLPVAERAGDEVLSLPLSPAHADEDVLASIALCQLDKLERHREIRLAHVAAYDAAAAELDGIEPLARDPRDTHALHLYVVRVDAERAGATRDEYQSALALELIGTSIHFLPVHELSAYRDLYPDQPPLPVAERAGREVLSLPLSPAHTDDDVADAIDALRRVHARFSSC